MDKNEQWLKWAVELQAIAQGGLFYGKDKFDIERYERIREISAEMISYKTEISTEKGTQANCLSSKEPPFLSILSRVNS